MTARTPDAAGIDRAALLWLIDGIEQQFQAQLAALRKLVAPEADAFDREIAGMAAENAPDRLTLQQAAYRAGRRETTIARWCQKIPGIGTKIGGQWSICPTALDAYCNRKPDHRRAPNVQIMQDLLQLLQED